MYLFIFVYMIETNVTVKTATVVKQLISSKHFFLHVFLWGLYWNAAFCCKTTIPVLLNSVKEFDFQYYAITNETRKPCLNVGMFIFLFIAIEPTDMLLNLWLTATATTPTYSHLLSRRATPSVCRYKVMLLGDRRMSEQLAKKSPGIVRWKQSTGTGGRPTRSTPWLSNIQPGSAGGPDGLRPQHLKELVSCQESGSNFLTDLTAFVNMVLAGRCPPSIARLFFGGRMLETLS